MMMITIKSLLARKQGHRPSSRLTLMPVDRDQPSEQVTSCGAPFPASLSATVALDISISGFEASVG